MATQYIKFKRSSVPGKRPSISQMDLGELALNTYDGRLFARKDNVGIGSTVTLLNVWTENIGGGAYYNDGFVGIGTTNPQAALEVYTNDGNIRIGDITEGTSSTDAGVIFSGLGTVTSAMFTEVNGEILSYGINVAQITGIQTERPGAIFRLDTRNGAFGDGNCFVVKGRSIGTTIEHNSIVINVNDGNTFLSPSKGVVVVGTSITTGTPSQNLQVTGGAYVSGNLGIGTTNPTSRLHISGDTLVTGVVTATTFVGALTGTASSATQLLNPRTFEITGDIVASPVSFNGTGNVSLAATIQPNSVGLGTDTTGDYVRDITGTANQITVTGGTGEGSAPVLSIPNQFTIPQDITVTRDLQVSRNLNVDGNITIGGTSSSLITAELKIFDSDIVLGFRTDGSGNDISNDNTANHGGVAIASTEGTPLVNLFIAGIETNPSTYKKIMWFKSGAFAGLGTDAWLSNYAVGIGSTQVPNGVRLAAGAIHVLDNKLDVRGDIDFSGTFYQNGSPFVASRWSAGTENNIYRLNGNVGIGTTNPTSQLHVIGNGLFSGVVTATTFIGALSGTATSTTNIPNLSGDVSSVNTVTTLATVNSNVGTFGDAGSIPRVTVNGKGLVTGVTTVAPNNGSLSLSVSGAGLSGSASFTANQAGNSTFTVTSNATSDNTNSTIVSRNGAGGFSAGIVTASTFSGNLQNTLTLNTSGTGLSGSTTFNNSGASTFTVTSNATSDNTNSTIVSRNGSGGFVAGIVTATFVGNVTGNLNSTGVNTATTISGTTLSYTNGTITNLNGTNVSYSGIGTVGSLNIGATQVISSSRELQNITSLDSVTTATIESAIVNTPNIFNDLVITGISTFTNGPILVGSGTSTGTSSQRLQVNGGAYVSGNIGIGTTNPTSKLQVQGDVLVTGITTSSEFVGGGSDLRNLSGTHLVSYASHSETSNSALSIAGISTYNQVGILTGSLAVDTVDLFGASVATSADGNTIIVSAYFDEIGATTNTGVVYVYDRVGSSFNQVGILTGSLAVDLDDNFGSSVATSADGKTIVVTAFSDEVGAATSTGVAYVYDRVGNSFNQVGILTGSLATDVNDRFGSSVATSADGKTIIVGAYQDEIGANNASGVVYVYDRVGNSFNQVGILTGSLAVDVNDNFGNSVATSADGKTIIVGAYQDEIGANNASGVVYVYDRIGNSFNQVGILTGTYAVDSNDLFGFSVATSADGKTIIVGAVQDEIGANNASGVVYVYDRIGNSFNHVGILTGSLATDVNDYFGFSVATSADGKTIIVGARSDEIGAPTSTGVAYIFNRQGNSFNQVGILTGSLAVNTADLFGFSVATSADGKTIIVGALQDEIGANNASGVVYVFDQTRDTYVYSGPTGNIGIGTTNPTSKLQVDGNATINGNLNVSIGGTFPIISTLIGEASGYNGSGIAVTQTRYGIGIGTTNPFIPFYSDSDSQITNTFTFYNTEWISANSYNNSITRIGSDSGRSIEIGMGNTDLPKYIDFGGGNFPELLYPDWQARILRNGTDNGSLQILNRGTGDVSISAGQTAGELGNFDIFTTGTRRLRVSSTGNIGLNVLNPTSRLHVSGDALVTGVVTATTFIGALSGTATSTTNIPNLSGDVSSVNTVTTLATVNSNVGTFGDAGAIPRVTVNGKGLVTGVTTVAPNNGSLSLSVSGTGLSGSASFTANQAGNSTFTVTSNATSDNTNSTIVSRNGSGGFVAGIVTASTFSGNLQNTLTLNTSGTGLSGSTTFNNSGASTFTVTSNATSDNTNSTIVSRDGSGNFSSGTITANLSGNATGLSGTPNITVGVITATDLTLSGNLTVNGTTTTLNTETLQVEDKNIELGSVTSPTNTTADGGGITLKGTTDKTFNWINATSSWTSSENLNLLTGKTYKINGTDVLSSTTLGSGVVNSSLTSVGTLTKLDVGNVNSTGIVTATSFVGALSGTATSTTNIPNLSGDVSSVNTVTTLATVNSNVGTFGDAGAIPRVTVNGKGLVTGVTTVAPNNGALTLNVSGTGLSGSASFTANQAGASTFTVTSNATSANTNSTIVSRDGAGGFVAGIVTATTFSGNLQNTLTLNTSGTGLSGSTTFNNSGASTFTVTSNATSANTNSTIVSRDGAGGFVAGIVTATDFNSASDLKLKENIQVIENPIDKILNINGVSFDWKETGKSSMGVIAQDVEKVLPELVNGTDSKTVNYNGLIGLLIEVVKEQQKEINILKERLG